AAHVDEERMVQRLQHQGDGRLLFGRGRGGAAVARRRERRGGEEDGKCFFHKMIPAADYVRFFRFNTVSSSTATTMTPPITICWRNDDTPSRFRPLRSTPMISAPTSVPASVPSPPIRLVPPITVAAMASSSYIMPAIGCAELSRAVRITAATALINPETA